MPKVYSAVKGLIYSPYAIDRRKGRFLVVQMDVQGVHLWDLPGGKCEYGETPYETLRREIYEEVGLEVEIERCLGMYWFARADGDQVNCTTFSCQSRTSTVNLHNNPGNDNIQEYQWVRAQEFLQDTYSVSNHSLKNLIRNI